MFRNLSRVLVVLVVLLAVVGTVAADGRINSGSFHLGGDTLFCYQGTGCELLNLNGVSLGMWSQADIDSAIAASDAAGANQQVGGDVQGSYGPAQLWVVWNGPDAVMKSLKLVGWDNWGKWSEFSFDIDESGSFVSLQEAVDPMACYVDLVANKMKGPNGETGGFLIIQWDRVSFFPKYFLSDNTLGLPACEFHGPR